MQEGTYKDIISSLFTNYEHINKALIDFFSCYNPKKIIKLSKSKKVNSKIEYIKRIIDCYETLNSILLSFTKEEEIISKIEPKIKELIKTNDEHYLYFVYFIVYNMYISSFNSKKPAYKEKDIKEIVSIIKYCNQNNIFNNSIEILKNSDELKINNELERLSNKCIELEKKQASLLKETINLLNQELEKTKNNNVL